MKNIYFCLFLLLSLTSCKKDDPAKPYTRTITAGSKWGIAIGSSPAEVYTQIKEMYGEKVMHIELLNRKGYTNPEEVKNLLPYYAYMVLENKVTNARLSVEFENDKVRGILGPINAFQKWPLNVSDANAIRVNDGLNDVYNKLVEIYKVAENKDFKMYFNSKPLDKPFDPDMGNYQWQFYRFSFIKAGQTGKSDVKLLFKNGKLRAIIDDYKLADMLYLY